MEIVMKKLMMVIVIGVVILLSVCSVEYGII